MHGRDLSSLVGNLRAFEAWMRTVHVFCVLIYPLLMIGLRINFSCMWSIKDELAFFNDAIRISSIESLMTRVCGRYYAFQPKNDSTKHVSVPNSRNALIGTKTEKWCKELLSQIAKDNNLHAVNGVICEEIGLSRMSPADLAFCTSEASIQRPENIKLIFEIKMGIVNNYLYDDDFNFKFCGDYNTHKGTPSLLRSDSMLKAIGKSINLRVDSSKGKRIPIVILGNSPIASSYVKKVDCLKKSGVIQKFISLYPNPTERDFISSTPDKGFETYDSPSKIEKYLSRLLNSEMNYFSTMMSNRDLGHIISMASTESTDELKGQRFIELLNL